MQGNGYLAIWSDLAPQNLTDWAHWITREHAARTRRRHRLSRLSDFSRARRVGEPLFHSV